eukprot:c23204_g1_i1 orf=867-5330(-)
MECPLGDIDLNREQTDILSDGETDAQDHGSTKAMDAPQQEAGLGMVPTNQNLTAVQMQQAGEASKQPRQSHEEPEEGEISEDNDHGSSVPDNDDKTGSAEQDDVTAPTKEPSPTVAKATATSYGRWSSRSNGDGRHGGWNLRSEASAYSGQPDKFYQFAWAKGIQGSPYDPSGDSPQEERLVKSRRTGDSSRSLHRSGSADRKSGWILRDRGIEYVKFMRSDDGYLYLQEGDRSDHRRGENRKGRLDKGGSERASKGNRELEEKYERSSMHEKEQWRRSDTRRSSRDIRKRENRAEGELEEGEIEGKQAMLAEKAAMDASRYAKGRDRQLGKQPSVLSQLKGRTDCETPISNSMSESHKEKLFTEISEHVRNVAVKDAQKSFMGVCRQLRRALRTLRDLNRDLSRANGKHIEGQQRKVLALTRDAFSGIRAAYAVRNTGIGKEQEQDTNAFPRLLELARTRCQSLFTSKQIQELESMMQAIGCRSRIDFLPKSHRRGFLSYEAERGEEKDLRIGESSGNTSATTQLESESSTDNSANDRALDLGDEAEQPLNPSADLNLGETPVDQPVNVVDNSTAGRVGFGGWFSLSAEQGDTQGYDDAKETGLTPIPMVGSIVDLNEKQCKGRELAMGADSKSNMLGNISVRNAHHAFVPQLDPVRALTSYHEKFAGKSQAAYSRLPSPTPSDEEGARANSANEASGVAAQFVPSEGEQAGKEAQVDGPPQGTQPSLRKGPIFATSKESHGRPTPPELTLFPSSEPPIVEDGSAEGLQTKLVPVRGPKKNRDPRRRLVSQPFDLELPQADTGGNEGFERTPWSHESAMTLSRELTAPKQPSSQTSLENPPPKGELVSLLTLAPGGVWFSEQQMQTSVMETPGDMVAVDASSHTSVDSPSNILDELSQKKRQTGFVSQEGSSKRQKIAVEGDDVAQPKASLDLETGVAAASGDDSNQGSVSETLSSQGATLLKQTAGSESTVKDISKPRMKPRDPRRALLGGVGEKSKAVATAVAKGENNAAALVTGASNLVAQGSGEAVGTTSLPNSTRNSTDKPANMVANAWPNSLVKNETLPVIGCSSSSQDSDSSGSNNRPDDLSKASKATGAETKVTTVKPPGKFDLNVSAAANSKQPQNVNHWDHLEPLLEGLDERQKQAVRQERARRIEEQSRMFVAKKLCLVLDLDHTLLNSAKFTEIEGEWEAKLQANELTERNKFSKEGSNKRELYRFQHMGMWTKLRPGIWNFLARASNLYELHVYTMGNKAYATEMAKLLDPTGTLFAGRVISKGDDGDIVDGDERPPKSKDLDGVLGMESAVVIIDDSARVWPHHRHNLIVVERYMYFPCSRKQFGLPGPSLLEVGHDEREQDGMLASALMVIEKIHYNFFSNPRLHEVDVRDILALEQRRVLAGCKLVFSRVFPQGEIQPHLHPLWQLAEQFGAVCSIGIDEAVTHVVAISLGTEKVNWALSTGRFVVRPSWLEASAILYRRASERDFSVSP